ncbi:MAG: HAD-IA family hydrolase [Planctomycetota bacterium]
MPLDGLFIDMYGTLTTGDKAAVEAVCTQLVGDTGVRRPAAHLPAINGPTLPHRAGRDHDGAPLTAPELAILWGERFFADMESCHGDGFRTLAQLEADSLVQTLAEFGVSVDPLPYVRRLIEYWRDPPLQPEAREFLQCCAAGSPIDAVRSRAGAAPKAGNAAARCLPICIVSNADRADLETAIARLGLPVAALVTSEEARSYKPHPAIFELALARTGWRRDRVVHVGDSLHSDIGGARAAGLRCAWVNRAHRIHDIGAGDPDHECTDLLDVLQKLGAD